MKHRFRIVRDSFAGYEVQVMRWWWPFSWKMVGVNTFSSIEKAKVFVDELKGNYRVVWEEEDPVQEANRIIKSVD